jgi:hypothetical protein
VFVTAVPDAKRNPGRWRYTGRYRLASGWRPTGGLVSYADIAHQRMLIDLKVSRQPAD